MKLNGVIECKFLPKTRTVQHPCPRLGQCRWECPPDHSAQKALANQCLYPSVLFDMGLWCLCGVISAVAEFKARVLQCCLTWVQYMKAIVRDAFVREVG